MTLSCIVAVAENGVIGRDNALPWRLPADLRRFRRLTTGHAIIMGRRTYESIGRPLPDRVSVVLTRDRSYRPAGVTVVHSLEQAIEICADRAEAFIIGGRAIFESALPRCQRLYLTRVEAEMEGDVTFPLPDLSGWTLVHEESHPSDERNDYPHTFQVYERL